MEAIRWVGFLEELADEADELALRYFGSQALVVREKPDLGPVTEADLAIEEMARARVAERHPGVGVFGEEQGETGPEGGLRLIIDPIDATRNFVRGIPIFGTLLAIEDAGKLIAGMVTAPALRARWSAARGGGAYRGKQRIHVSPIRALAEAQLFHGSLGGVELPGNTPNLLALARKTQRQRGFGDFYQHVLVAEGAGELAVDPLVAPWDIAPLQVLIEEAGGRATSLGGTRSIYEGSLLSSNGRLHAEALATLNPS